MTRTSHHPHPTPAFPVYCLDWAGDDTLVLGGGGGASRSGIDNKLKLCKVTKDGRKVKYITEHKLSNEEDAFMTLAIDRAGKRLITGVNASMASVKAGNNKHCRAFSYAEDKILAEASTGTITATWSEDYPYQKFTSISTNASLVAIGTTDNKVSLLRYPSLEPAAATIELESELVDLDWGGEKSDWLAITTVSAILIYRVDFGEKVSIELRQTLYPPSLDISAVSFRAARFSPLSLSSLTIHAVLNAAQTRKRGAPRKAFVCTFGLVGPRSSLPVTSAEKANKGKEKEGGEVGDELGKWDVLVRREVAGKPVTVFDVSADGKLLAYGCSDLSIGILDSKTLAPLLKILHAHSFPPTALKFNPSANLLVSASADNTIRAIVVPASFGGLSMTMIALIVAILVLIMALLFRR